MDVRLTFLHFYDILKWIIKDGKESWIQMKKNLKVCIEQPMADEMLCLVDMNQYDLIEKSGMTPDLVHKKTAHISAAWRFARKKRVSIPQNGIDLSAYRYLSFWVFAVNGAGGSFSLFFDSSEKKDGASGYEHTFTIAHDGWNEYRVELPFMRAVGTPFGWDHINSIDFDCVFGGQSNRKDTVLYFDTLFVRREFAPPLYETMPELKGAAAFAKNGNFAIVNRKRIALSIDDSDVRPFEEKGTLWIPMGAIAAVIAHNAVADNKACTLNFTYRRKKYSFEAKSAMMRVDGVRQSLPFAPLERKGILFFPANFVRDFFHWRQIFTDVTGLIVFSNHKKAFDNAKDAKRIWQLVSDMTFHRPTGEELLSDLHKKIKNPGRGRVLATYDELMQLRKLAKSDETLKGYVEALKQTVGTDSDEALTVNLEHSSKKLIALSMLYRVTGDKQYCERVAKEAEAIAALTEWGENSILTISTVAFGMSIAYDWCHHMWSEARKAVIERAILRNALRPGVEAYNGKKQMWDVGSADGAKINAGFLASALAMADIYPETTWRLLNHIPRNAESVMEAFSPDGGFAEGVCAWERGAIYMALICRMLETACNTDYGFSQMPGFASTAYFPMYTETKTGAWNYHNCKADAIDTSILPYFSKKTENPIFAWLRRRELIGGKKTVTPWDVLFYQPVDDHASFDLPMDVAYRRAGLAVMREDWSGEGMMLGLHGGRNNERDGDLDAGSFILECGGERFFAETGGNEAISMKIRRRAEGQNTVVVGSVSKNIPDQTPGAVAPLTEMRSSHDCVYAIVDMTATNDEILRAKRGVMLTNNRTVAVIQDEIVLRETESVIWNAYTPATVVLNKSGRVAKLKMNGKILVCRLCGIGHPTRFEAKTVGESGLTRLSVRVDGKERVRMAVVCYLQQEGDRRLQRLYDMVPMTKWSE